MLYFKACPRCKTGAVEHNDDPYGGYLQCLNCGFMHDLPEDATPADVLRRLIVEYQQLAETGEAAEKAAQVA